ncbi:hypothetical protein Tco_0958557, partial [Tanacetum coccineum]
NNSVAISKEDKVEVFRILARQIIRFAAKAGNHSLSFLLLLQAVCLAYALTMLTASLLMSLEVVFPSSKFDGTPREVLSSRGNAKISSEKSIRTSSQKPHPRRMLHLEPWDKALLTGGDFSEPGRVFWGADEEISDGGVPRVIVYGYDGLPMQPVDPPSPDYVPGPEHPASPDYVPGPEHPPSPIEIPFVPEPEYPEYLVPSEDEAPMEDQPLPADASPVALSPGYVPDSDPEEDPEEDSEEEHADYPADGGDGDDEPSGDDTDDDDADDDDEEPFEDEEDDEEEEEHLAPADSPVIPVVDPVPSAGDTEAFETDESAPTPRPPQIRIPFAQTRLRRARKSVRPEPPMSASMEARIAEHAAAPTPPLPVASSPLPLPSPLTTSPTDAGAPLGYRAAGIRMRAADASPPLSLPPTSPRTDVPEAEMPPRKRACLTTPAPGYEIGESSAAGAARQPGPTPAVDTWDEIVEAMMEIAPTTLEGVDQRVTELDTTVRQRTEEFEIRFEEAHDDRAYLGALVNTLYRERLQHRRTALAIDREAVYARIAWTSSEERSAAIEAHVRTLEAQVATLIAQTTSLQTQLTTALGRIATLEARDPEPQDGPAEAGSSSVAAALAERDASRSRDGDNSHGSGTGGRRQVPTQRECTYTDFLKCQPINFNALNIDLLEVPTYKFQRH